MPQRNFPHVLAAFYGSPWAILPEKFREIEAVLWRRVASGPAAYDDGEYTPRAAPPPYQMVGSAAVVQVHGTITPRPSIFSEWSGGTSAEQIGRAVDAAAADPKAEAIVLDIDSPGGSVFGIADLGAKVMAARKAKPVHAVANHMAASAAYWVGTQAHTLAVTSGGWVGSVGVIWPRTDDTQADEQAGVRTTFVTAGENKADGHGPVTDGELARMQEKVNEYYAMFTAAVAKGRGVSVAKVLKDFGQGDVKLPAGAIESRMADRVATLEQVVAEVNAARTAKTKRKVAADLAANGFPTA